MTYKYRKLYDKLKLLLVKYKFNNKKLYYIILFDLDWIESILKI